MTTTIMADNFPAAVRPKLPMNIAWRSYSYVFSNFGTVLSIAFLPLLIVIASYVVLYVYFPPETVIVGDRAVRQQNSIASLVALPVQFIATAIFIVGIHRLAINGERPGGFPYFRLKAEEFIYILVAFILTLLFLLIIAAAIAFGYVVGPMFNFGEAVAEMPYLTPGTLIGYIAGIVLTVWPMVRLVLSLPHAAVTGKINFGLSWSAMKGNFWRFIGISVITGLIGVAIYLALLLIIGVAVFALSAVLPQSEVPASGADYNNAAGLAIIIFPGLLFLLFIGYMQGVSVTVLSFCYRALIKRDYELTA